MYVCTEYVCIYTCVDRERERERQIDVEAGDEEVKILEKRDSALQTKMNVLRSLIERRYTHKSTRPSWGR